MLQNTSQATVKSLGFEFPQNGEPLFSQLSFSIGTERCALVGPNGVGKSTLAQLLSGELTPTTGEILVSQAVYYLRQTEVPPSVSVAEYLAPLWEKASVRPELWGPLIEGLDLEKSLLHLSGGEWMRLRIALAVVKDVGLLILDEPTNNLDAAARAKIVDFVKGYEGALLVISHDREVLRAVDKILEISSRGISVYGGNYDFYLHERDLERARHENLLEKSRQEKKRVERESHQKIVGQEKRQRRGKEWGDSGSLPRILVGGLKRQAQQTLGKIQTRESERVEKAQKDFTSLYESGKKETSLGLVMPETHFPEGKMVLEAEAFNIRYGENWLWSQDLSLSIRGPRRWALAGPNGAGKTSFVRALLGSLFPAQTRGRLQRGDLPWAYLDQNYDLLQPDESVLDNVMESSRYDRTETRNWLARFQFFEQQALQKVSSLSGGERLKAALAKILLADPVPQLLILDEPTNNLDLQSLEILEEALNLYQGALLVISHDEDFLKNIGIEEVCLLQSQTS